MVTTWFDVYTDVNECEEYHGLCEQNCTNTVGSYGCECSAGYSLNEDEHNCDGINSSFQHVTYSYVGVVIICRH